MAILAKGIEQGGKSMWTIISEKKINEDIGEYTAYGVRYNCYCISDICTDPEEIGRFVRILNAFDVSPVNALDIAEDYLADGIPGYIMADRSVTA